MSALIPTYDRVGRVTGSKVLCASGRDAGWKQGAEVSDRLLGRPSCCAGSRLRLLAIADSVNVAAAKWITQTRVPKALAEQIETKINDKKSYGKYTPICALPSVSDHLYAGSLLVR